METKIEVARVTQISRANADGFVTVQAIPKLSSGRWGDFPKNYQRVPETSLAGVDIDSVVNFTLEKGRPRKTDQDGNPVLSGNEDRDYWWDYLDLEIASGTEATTRAPLAHEDAPRSTQSALDGYADGVRRGNAIHAASRITAALVVSGREFHIGEFSDLVKQIMDMDFSEEETLNDDDDDVIGHADVVC